MQDKKLKCPLCNSELPKPKIEIVERCFTKFKAKVSMCSDNCGFMYCEILEDVDKNES